MLHATLVYIAIVNQKYTHFFISEQMLNHHKTSIQRPTFNKLSTTHLSFPFIVALVLVAL